MSLFLSLYLGEACRFSLFLSGALICCLALGFLPRLHLDWCSSLALKPAVFHALPQGAGIFDERQNDQCKHYNRRDPKRRIVNQVVAQCISQGRATQGSGKPAKPEAAAHPQILQKRLAS
ncbi:MAG: hypothetical protein EOP50_18535 [Sphingobacteriales bacterium]|nr:MAG: hypothetical protein EOP50_18535 [Sphingobacteriales bacterium]